MDGLNVQWGSIGYNASYADRPMLAVGRFGVMTCTWEQFDSLNVEPTTGILRADVFVAGSFNNGATWGPPIKVAESDRTSHRFPSLARVCDGLTVHIVYMQDQQAGEAVQRQGDPTNNPVIYVTGELTIPMGAEERRLSPQSHLGLSVSPNPFGRNTIVTYSLPRAGPAQLRVYDASGRLVRSLLSGLHPAGDARATWDACDEVGRAVPSGIYFARLETGTQTMSRKLTLNR